MFLLLCQIALAETDTIGSDDIDGDNADMMKLVEIHVSESAAITQLSFAVHVEDQRGELILVAYHQVGDRFELVGQAEATITDDDRQQWAESGEISWLFSEGETYAIGAFVPSNWGYYYEENHNNRLWFGDVTGTYQVDSEVRDVIETEDRQDYCYYMQVESIAADADGDGFAALEIGGTDCDDSDPDIGEATTEIPYDGIDQDCNGSDLTDIDADGVNGTNAGGADCNDNDAAIVPGAVDSCEDGVDQDCSGDDEACSGGDGDVDGSGGGSVVDASPDCGCDAGAGLPALGAMLLAAAATRSRRRRD